MTPRTARIILAALALTFVAFLVIIGVAVVFFKVVGVAIAAAAAWLGLALLVSRALDDA